MASFEGTYTRYLLRTGDVQQARSDTPVAIRLRYVGTGTVTSVTTTTATNIVMITSDGGTDTYAFATYDTVAKLIGAINADAVFQAKVLDGLNTDATASRFVTGAITSGTDSNGVVVWDVLADTSAAKELTVCLTGNRDWDTNWFNAEKVGSHRAVLQEIKYNVTLGGAGANLVRIYIRRGTPGNTETQIFGDLSVSASATTISWASGQGFISGKDGDEIICRIQDGTSITDAAANYFRASGYLE